MRTQIPPKNPAFTFVKGNVYCFSRAIPKDLKSYYCRPRVIQPLRTTNRRHAVHSSRLLSARLEDYWHDLRLRKTQPLGLVEAIFAREGFVESETILEHLRVL